MPERTLVLVKPDGVRRGLVGEVISRLERKGLAVVAIQLRTLDRATAEEHYGEHREKPFFGDLVTFITGGPLVALVAEGPRAVEAVRRIMGSDRPGAGHAWLAAGGLRAGDWREPRARIGLTGVRGQGDRAVLPRPHRHPAVI